MKYYLCVAAFLICVAPATSHAQANAQVKEKLRSCQAEKVKEKMTRRPFSTESGVTCRGGEFKGLVPRCDRQDKDGHVTYAAPETHKIVSAARSIVSKTDRGSVGNLQFNEKSASVSISCRGNGCDKREREWATARISGEIERRITADDMKQAMDQCLDELLK
jgi:recombination DNA repair RAD52 pathway protein